MTRNHKFYIHYILLSLIVVEGFFAVQVMFVIKTFEPEFAIVPTLLGIIIGMLLAKRAILRIELGRQRRLFHAIADDVNEFSYFRTLGGVYEYASPAALMLTGYDVDHFYRTPNFMDTIIHPDDRALWQEHVHEVNAEGKLDTIELRLVHKDGSVRWIEHLCSPVYEHGSQIGVRSVNIDITARKEHEAKISHMANYDLLSGLPNRYALKNYLETTIETYRREGKRFALLFIDLDRFKYINDTLGHTIGDELLKRVATRLHENSQHCFICRFGGDEFVQILPEVQHKEQIETFAQTQIANLRQDFHINGYSLYISASVGVAVYPDNGHNAETLIKNADFAMYDAKQKGSGFVSMYDSLSHYQIVDNLLLEKGLREAIDAGDIEVYYQPKYSEKSHAVCSAEALVRWKHNGSMVSPDLFIPLAEYTGAILPLGELVIEKVFANVSQWYRDGIGVPVAINISPRQLNNSQLVAFMKRMLDTYGARGEWFEIEITENFLLQENIETIQAINDLKSIGFSIALDDFGTGYSSLSYLNQYPFDVLKIDRSFVSEMTADDKKHTLVQMMITLAQEFGLELVAEGVETEHERDMLLDRGCHIFQGYYYYKPIPEADFDQLLRQVRV